MGPDHLQDIVDEAARVSGCPVTLEDREFNLVAFCSHSRAGDAVRQDSILTRRSTPQVRTYFESFGIARAAGPVRIPPDSRRGLLGRICIPVRWQSVTYGYLWLLEDGLPIAGGLLPELAATAGRVGVEMARRSRLRDDLGWKVGDLLSTYPETRTRAAEEIAESWALSPRTPVAAVCVEAVVPHAAPEGIVAESTGRKTAWKGAGSKDTASKDTAPPAPAQVPLNAWRLPRTVLVGSGEHASTFIVPLSAAGDLSAARAVTRTAFAALPTPSRAVAGIGGSVGSLARARESWLQARIAARVAASRSAEHAVLEWPGLGVHRLLGIGTDSALRDALSAPGVAQLLAEGGADLIHTAAVYLDEAGSAQRTAAALGVHRQTLYHRLDRIERLSGLNLDSGRDRLQLHLALTLLPSLAD